MIHGHKASAAVPEYAHYYSICHDRHSSPECQPWDSPVVGKFDASLNLYWISSLRSQHSQNGAFDPRNFVVVYDSRSPESKGEGLYLQMRAWVLDTLVAIRKASSLCNLDVSRHPFPHAQFLGECPHRLYKAEAVRSWYNVDGIESGHIVDMRTELFTQEG